MLMGKNLAVQRKVFKKGIVFLLTYDNNMNNNIFHEKGQDLAQDPSAKKA